MYSRTTCFLFNCMWKIIRYHSIRKPCRFVTSFSFAKIHTTFLDKRDFHCWPL
uniref:Uncharacterized protein n=1 Tax=Anguilla anguilla TaxID=7936 RepID=A0A0E9X1W5_ANGAN